MNAFFPPPPRQASMPLPLPRSPLVVVPPLPDGRLLVLRAPPRAAPEYRATCCCPATVPCFDDVAFGCCPATEPEYRTIGLAEAVDEPEGPVAGAGVTAVVAIFSCCWACNCMLADPEYRATRFVVRREPAGAAESGEASEAAAALNLVAACNCRPWFITSRPAEPEYRETGCFFGESDEEAPAVVEFGRTAADAFDAATNAGGGAKVFLEQNTTPPVAGATATASARATRGVLPLTAVAAGMDGRFTTGVLVRELVSAALPVPAFVHTRFP